MVRASSANHAAATSSVHTRVGSGENEYLQTLLQRAAAHYWNRLVIDTLVDADLTTHFNELKRLTNLRSLDIAHTEVTDACIEVLHNAVPKLEYLNLGGTGITDKGAECLGKCFPGLKMLDLFETALTDKGVASVVTGATKLDSLFLRSVRLLSDIGVQAIVESLPNLIRLNLSQTRIKDHGLSLIASRLRSLESLEVRYTRVGNPGVAAVTESLVALRRLNLWRTRLDDKGLREMFEARRQFSKLPHLEFLELRESNVTLQETVLRDGKPAKIAAALFGRAMTGSSHRLTDRQRTIWNKLDNAFLSAAELTAPGKNGVSAESAVRKTIGEIRNKIGKDAILWERGVGYWRPDAKLARASDRLGSASVARR